MNDRVSDQMHITMPHLLLAVCAWWLCVGLTPVCADEVDYLKQVKPIFAARCHACHGALKQNAKLRLDTAAFAIKGGKQGPAIKPGDAGGSTLLDRIASTDELDRMPPEGEPLKPSEIATIRAWITQGAKAPPDEMPERNPEDHWAFNTPVRPAVPKVADAAWSKNPIDAFIEAGRAQRGLTHQIPADKRIWLRRVTIDLTGLPPTQAELDAFVSDASDDAIDKVVTRLLDSPQYGERWGRHWMDIWRYSDWWGLGAEVRNSQKHIWHWRDWIIESLNADKAYDQMLREMLAADELHPSDMDRLRATGFLARQYFKFNRTSWLDEAVEHTAKAMLGLTFNCAKCHDHKYDPISHVEYYQLRAFFEPYQVRTDAVPGELDFEKNGIPRAFDCNLDAVTHLHLRGDERSPDKTREIKPTVPAFLAHGPMKIAAIELPVESHQPGVRSFVVETHLKLAEQRITQSNAELVKAKQILLDAETAAKTAVDKDKHEGTAQADKPDAMKQDKTPAKPIVQDDFAMAMPDVWEIRSGMWTYTEGKLVQSQTGTTRAAIRLKKRPPADFEAKLKYIPTGGDMWKSIGIAFDATEQDNMVTAYLSSYAGGPKSQITYRHNGGDVYPPHAAQARKVDLNKPHEIILRVRGSLLNVQVDGEHSIAYRLPIERQRGHLEISAFDAKAQLLSFELRELPTDVVLVEGDASSVKPKAGPPSVEEAKLLVTIAEKAIVTAKAQPASIRARAAAMLARHAKPVPDNIDALVADAVRAERVATTAKADEDADRAALAHLRAAQDKKAEAARKLADAKTAFDKAKQMIDAPGDAFTPLAGSLKTLESNIESEASRSKPFPQKSTGRRTALAQWITDPKNPLPARVAVNHIWSRHMGRPLVATVFDFGRNGAAPTHPQLLDWLAVELVEHNWSMKHIHRLIVTSQTYRLSSSNLNVPAQTIAADPDNHYFWRANPIRVEAQVVRDSLLHLAGELDLTRGGPSIPVNNEASRRRSLYFVHSHNEHHKFLSMFDDANVLDCYRRTQSIVPQQALALENSPLAVMMARKIAQRITAAAPAASDREFIRAAFLLVLCAQPTDAEQALMLDAMSQLTETAKRNKHADPIMQAKTQLVHALLNHNDFVTVR